MADRLKERTVFVTGASGGLGQEFVRQALAEGAVKVYAASRGATVWDDPRVDVVALDITDPAAVAAAAAEAGDVDLLVNNAGIAPAGDSIAGPESDVRAVFETNFFAALSVADAFSAVLAANGGGTLLNILSAAAWIPVPTAYAASKAALWSATNGLRVALADQGTQVIGLLVGMVDTPMSQRWDVPKVTAESVVAQAYAGVADGALEILADDSTRQLKSQLNTPGEQFYPALHEMIKGFVA